MEAALSVGMGIGPQVGGALNACNLSLLQL